MSQFPHYRWDKIERAMRMGQRECFFLLVNIVAPVYDDIRAQFLPSVFGHSFLPLLQHTLQLFSFLQVSLHCS